ncbi:MAG TPA: RNA 2',3'-cyclic phosphodiesterase [Chthonomonadales bacterium]|nr:RNA 2',3'-cyclic phosphodiesterase [Chthonomonadales bacterium]
MGIADRDDERPHRLFFAIEIPFDGKEWLRARQEALRGEIEKLQASEDRSGLSSTQPQCKAVSWVDPCNFHVTLRFLGDTPAARVGEAAQAAHSAAESAGSLQIEIAGLTWLPPGRRPRVLCATLKAQADIARLAANLETRLRVLGFAPEHKPFRAHVTLGRIARHESGNTAIAALRTIRNTEPEEEPTEHQSYQMVANGFALMQSKLDRAGSTYSIVERFRFSGS